jgi:hypothetical protein
MQGRGSGTFILADFSIKHFVFGMNEVREKWLFTSVFPAFLTGSHGTSRFLSKKVAKMVCLLCCWFQAGGGLAGDGDHLTTYSQDPVIIQSPFPVHHFI